MNIREIKNPNIRYLPGKKKYNGKEVKIIIEKKGKFYEILKLLFNSKGDIYFLPNYHKSKEGFITKIIVDYKHGTSSVPVIPLERYKFNNQKSKPKISYHQSGFVHVSFSHTGESKKDLGFNSYSYKEIAKGNFSEGPRLCLTIGKIEKSFNEIDLTKNKKDVLLINYSDLLVADSSSSQMRFQEEVVAIDIFLYPKNFKKIDNSLDRVVYCQGLNLTFPKFFLKKYLNFLLTETKGP